MTARTAFVAGASGALGAAICAELAAAGLRVAVHARTNAAAATELVASLPGSHLAVVGDLHPAGAPSLPVQAALDAFGRIDVLVNAAHPALPSPRPVGELTSDDLDAQLEGVRVHAALCRDVIPSMRTNHFGRVVFVAGALMQRPAPGFGAYGAAKAAATTLTRYVALEEGRHGITANVVAPGRVAEGDDEPMSPERRELAERLRSQLALGAFPTPADVARVIRTLTDPASDALTGQTIWVTGGEPIA